MIEMIGRSLLSLLAVPAFLLPGWLIARWARAPWPALTGFLASTALWFHLVLAADAAGIPLHRGVALGLWLGLALLLLWLARRPARAQDAKNGSRPQGVEWLWVGCAAGALISIGLRSVVDPLSGWDNAFRWDHLARLFVADGHLHFYPPVEVAAFERYAWSDGIPPLASLLNAWIYLFTGTTAPQFVAVRVIGETVLLGAAVFVLARTLWGERASWPAVGIAATSALLLWGVMQAQEVALLAIATVTMLACLTRLTAEPTAWLAGWAGVAAAVGALSREYGLVLLVLGAGFLLLRRANRPFITAFLIPAVGLSAVWYARNAILTGNPLYPQTFGGFLPGNAFFDELLACISDYWRLGGAHIQSHLLTGALLVVAGGPVIAAAAGAWRGGRAVLLPLATLAVFFVLWAVSVRMTAGGVNYSLRVLTPAVAMLAALGGAIGCSSRRTLTISALLGLLLSVDAARRAWLLPVTPLAAPLPYSWSSWAAVRATIVAERTDPRWARLVQRAGGAVIAVDSPSAHAAVTAHGGRAAMLFSPVFRSCFAGNTPPAVILSQLRDANVRLLTLHPDDPVIRRLIARNAFFGWLVAQPASALEGPGCAVYDLATLQPQAP